MKTNEELFDSMKEHLTLNQGKIISMRHKHAISLPITEIDPKVASRIKEESPRTTTVVVEAFLNDKERFLLIGADQSSPDGFPIVSVAV